MLPYLEKFERAITHIPLVLMAGVVLLATIKLAWILVKDVLSPPLFLLEPKELPEGTLLGIAALVLALALGYYVMRRSRQEKGDCDLESKE